MFDEQPDGDLHGECRLEICRLEKLVTSLKSQLNSEETIRRVETQRVERRVSALSALMGADSGITREQIRRVVLALESL